MKLKPYPEYRDSGIKWIGEIPEGWGVRKLKYICTKYAEYGLNISSDNYQTEGIRFIRTTDIDDYGNLQNRGIYLNKSLCKGYTLNCGDLLISRSGTIGRTFLFNSKKNGEATYAGYLVRFSINKNKAMPKYVFYFTKTNSFFGWLEIQSIETTIENVNGQKYANLLLTIPPLPDQIVIANFLDSKTSKIDALIEKDKKLIELLKEKRTALINHAVTKGLDPNEKMKKVNLLTCHETPKNWQIIRIKFVLRLSRGVDLSNDNFKEGNIPIYGSNGIIGYHNKATSKGPGVTVGRSGSVGEVNYVSEERYWAHNTSLYLQENYGNNVRYIYYLLLISDLKHLAAGSAVGTLNRNYIHNLFVSLPSKSEQQKIVDYLDKATDKIDRTIQKIEEKINLLEKYKKSLIHHTVTGKIDVRGSEI